MKNNFSETFKSYSIVVSCFSRSDLLDICLKSITEAECFDKFNLIVLHQLGHEEVSRVLDKYSTKIDFKIEVNSQISKPLGNINWNRLATYELSFELLNSEFTLGIEEDIEISEDALKFVIEMHERYRNTRSYRGINLGSISLNGDASDYSYLRYGLHGQAGTITLKSWKSLPLEMIKKRLDKHPLDGMFEAYLKTGFMLTPIRSKYLDRGWGGTHAPSDPDHGHYLAVKESFLPTASAPYRYARVAPMPSWRLDCQPFKRSQDLIYYMCFFTNLLALRFDSKLMFKVASKLESFTRKRN